MKPLRVLGHPVHPALIHIPLGMFPAALVFDLIFLSTDNPRWADVSFWMLSVGLIGALFAAAFGLVDWLAIPARTRAYRVGLAHGLANLAATLLFAVSWAMRYYAVDVVLSPRAFAFTALGVFVAVIAAWLGGELVTRHGVGVDRDADLNAPSSLHHVTDQLSKPDVGGHLFNP